MLKSSQVLKTMGPDDNNAYALNILIKVGNNTLNGAGVFLARDKISFILFVMYSFGNQIISTVKKIRNANRQPDAEKIFKTITKESALNLALDDVQQKLREIQNE